MAAEVTSSDRVWPKTGLWAASYRVMFPLAALWAALCVGLWQWVANLDLSLGWHIHEMTFGFAGAALAGYLLTACPSWTVRAPPSGWPLMLLALLWVATRLGLLTGLYPLSAVTSLAFFIVIALVLRAETRKGGKPGRPGFLMFCLAAGVGSALWITKLHTTALPLWAPYLPILGFSLLLIVVGGQLVPAFLSRAAILRGQTPHDEPAWLSPLAIAALLMAVMGLVTARPEIAGGFLRLTALLLIARMAFWSLKSTLHNPLLAILALGFLWLPTGTYLWGASLNGTGPLTEPQALHALIMGAMGGLILAVSARSIARRTPDGLRPRAGIVLAFGCIWVATWARMFDALDLAALLWCVGWLLYAALFLPALHGPVPRPVFSGARNT
ncbi:NnrS family protein [uncultured Shimia sp.]|uniref:NnrS family protein n=1 Tax=uncultured Shimia sp. TaxID=573152 RepID=UPI00262D0681|nr:NnrS family protein [uncultured Shimia sp.]